MSSIRYSPLAVAILVAVFAPCAAGQLTITTSSPLPTGTVNTPYSQTLTATGGTTPYSWSATGLPPWLTLDPSTGALTGTPPAPAVHEFTVQVTDSGTPIQTASVLLTLTIVPPPLAITTTELPSGTTGVAYSATLQAAGGTPPLAWSAPGGLPGWLTLNASTGGLTGTPASAGTYYFAVQVTDSGTPTPQTATKALSITVASGLTVATGSLAGGSVSVAYSQALAASGGIAPYSWALTGGSLPPGLSLASNGQISGTPTAAGTFAFTVQVTDSANPAATATKSLSITVTPALTIMTASPLPDGVVGRSYSAILTASGGSPPYANWLVVSGALPSGVSLSSQAGSLSGIPAAAGVFSFTVRVTDSASAIATKNFTLTVSSSLSIATATLPAATTGTTYSQTLTATGGTLPYTWMVVSGGLPLGLSLSSAGTLSGTPTRAGTYAFSVRVTDSAATPATAVRDFALLVTEGLAITSPSQLPSGSVGVAYSTTLTASGGRAPYTWSVASGSLPSGLSLAASTGILSGTPSAPGAYSFVLQLTDSTPTSATKAVSVSIAAALAITTPAQLPPGVTSVAYSEDLTASGGTAPYTWAVVRGQLPAGLRLSSAGSITGTPTITGSFNFTVQVTDKTGNTTALEFSITISSSLSITTEATLPNGLVGLSYSQTLSAAGGTAPYSDWRVVSGILPAGLSLDPATGRLSGAPTAAGTLKFTIQVKDATGKTGSKEFTLTIRVAALTITTPSPLPSGVVGRAYSQTFEAGGGVPPYTWTLTAGSLPAGLSLAASTGQISGTPSALASGSFTVEVTDSAGKTDSKAFMLTIDPPPLPAVQISGPAETVEPAQQPRVRLTLASRYPVPLTGQLGLAFVPDAVNPSDDPAVQFSTGGRTVSFSIAANATEATFPAASLAFQTGTVAGTITLRATLFAGGRLVTPTPAPVRVCRLLRAAPVIRSVQVERTSSGFDVVIKGFSSPRQVTQATFRFIPAAGANLQTTELTVPLTTLADRWFQGQESGEYGSQFTLRQPFTVQGDSRAVSAVSVILANSVGTSQAVSAGF